MKTVQMVLALGLWAGAVAEASWFPPSHFVVSQKFLQKREKLKSVWMKNDITLMEGEKPTSIKLREVFQWDAALQTWQLKLTDLEGAELFVYQRKILGPQTVIPGIDPSSPPLPTYFFLEPAADRVVQALNRWGIYLKSEQDLAPFKDETRRRSYDPYTLQRWKGDIVWAVGGYDRSQVWMDCARFLPMRFLLQPRKGSVSGPISYEFEYAPGAGGDLILPKATDLWSQEQRLMRVEMQQVAINAKVELLPATTVWGLTEAGQGAEDKVRELIEWFVQYFR